MLRKADLSFGAEPVTGKRLPCDFNGMRNLRAKSVTIYHIPNSAGRRRIGKPLSVRKHARIARRRRSGFGFPGERRADAVLRIAGLLHSPARRWRSQASRRADFPMGVLPRFIRDFILFYLTQAMIFDNRPGLLKKFYGARAAETLSAVKPHE
jgi:hypothetical protein